MIPLGGYVNTREAPLTLTHLTQTLLRQSCNGTTIARIVRALPLPESSVHSAAVTIFGVIRVPPSP